MTQEQELQFSKLLVDAVNTPGSINKAYSLFWNYSSANQMYAMWQAMGRGLQVGPIASYNRWKELGRYVKKGEKAIELCMPVTCKKTKTEEAENGQKEDVTVTFRRFVFRRNWFMLCQTDGAEYIPEPIPGWDKDRALEALDITEEAYDLPDGNTQGYASGRTIHVSPIASHPHKTRFHELAHIMLGHTTTRHDGGRSLIEAEAEAVALICLESLGLDGAEYCRGYIQRWLAGAPIPETSARQIFKTADTIIKAGRQQTKTEENVA